MNKYNAGTYTVALWNATIHWNLQHSVMVHLNVAKWKCTTPRNTDSWTKSKYQTEYRNKNLQAWNAPKHYKESLPVMWIAFRSHLMTSQSVPLFSSLKVLQPVQKHLVHEKKKKQTKQTWSVLKNSLHSTFEKNSHLLLFTYCTVSINS